MAEAEDLKSSKCGFDPHRGHSIAIFLTGQTFTAYSSISLQGFILNL